VQSSANIARGYAHAKTEYVSVYVLRTYLSQFTCMIRYVLVSNVKHWGGWSSSTPTRSSSTNDTSTDVCYEEPKANIQWRWWTWYWWHVIDVRDWVTVQTLNAFINKKTCSFLFMYIYAKIEYVSVRIRILQTRGQSNLTKKAPHGGPIPRLGVTPGGRNLYHWIPGVGVPISVP